MWWIPLATMAAGALMGKEKARHQQKQYEASMKMRAAEQRYAPWTGRTSFTQPAATSSPMGEMVAGGMAGLGTGMSVYGAAKSMGGPEAPKAPEQNTSLPQGDYAYGMKPAEGMTVSNPEKVFTQGNWGDYASPTALPATGGSQYEELMRRRMGTPYGVRS